MELLGEGTYGKVWKARQVSTGRVVAVKVVYVDDDLEEIQLEIGILQKCKTPYVVGCYGSYDGQEDDGEGEAIWIVMEVCDAGSVNDLMFMCGHTLREGQIRHVVASTLLGLVYLHDKDIVHRDVKSGNLLLTPDGNVKLSDFGVSGVLDKGTRKRNTAIGAPFWMAPEVIQEEDYDGRCDVWSLGITIIEMAEARPPHSEVNPMRVLFLIPYKEPPKLAHPDRWSNDMNHFVAQCLVKEHENRPTARQLLQHPFIRDVVTELEANKGKSEVIKLMVKASMPAIEKFRTTGGGDFDDDDDDDSSSETSSNVSSLPSESGSSMASRTKTRVRTIRKSLVKTWKRAAAGSFLGDDSALQDDGHGALGGGRRSTKISNRGSSRASSVRMSAALSRKSRVGGRPKTITKSQQANMGLDDVLELLAQPDAVDKIDKPSPMLATVMTEQLIKMLKTQTNATGGLIGDVPTLSEGDEEGSIDEDDSVVC